MLRGLEHVNRAVQILVGRNAMLNQRLYEAAREFEAALGEPGQWPAELWDRAIRIDKKLTAKGRADQTINGMDVPDAEQIAEEILDLSTAIDAVCVRRHSGETFGPRRIDSAGRRRRFGRSVPVH